MDFQSINFQSIGSINKVEAVTLNSSKEESDLINEQNKKKESAEIQQPLYSEQAIEAIVDKANTKILGKDMRFEYETHKRTGRTIIKLIDMQTNQVLREVPPKEMLDIVGRIWDEMGIAVDKKG